MPRSLGHAFYDKLQMPAEGGFDGFVQTTCKALLRASDGAVIAAGPLFPHAHGRVF